MSDSSGYLGSLESLHTMLRSYPTRAQISAIHIAANNRPAIIVGLREAETALLAAGLVEWQRLLARPEIWVWRTPNGQELHIAVTGYGSECTETPILVLAGPIPYDERFDLDLDRGVAERLSNERLYYWFGTEIVRTWPFSTHENTVGIDH